MGEGLIPKPDLQSGPLTQVISGLFHFRIGGK
jgi:hypothetical protein